MKLRPLGDRVILQYQETEEKTQSGIILPGSAKEKPHPLITNDGVTIAKEIELEDRYENMGAQLVKEVATRTNDTAGDGTTTATVLTQALVREGLKNIAAGQIPLFCAKA